MEDQKFNTLVNEYLEAFYQASPVWATYVGEHKYDHRLDDYSQEAIKEEIVRLSLFKQKLDYIDTLKLNLTNQADYQILWNGIEDQLLHSLELKPWENSPVMYTYLIGGSINSLISRDFAPLKDRLSSVASRLKCLPILVQQAKDNLKNPPEIQTQTAIRQNLGNINLIKNDLTKLLEQAPEMKDTLLEPMDRVVKVLESFQAFLEQDLLPQSTGDFRLGRELFEKKLKYTLESDLSPEEVVKRAEQELTLVRQRMFQLAQPLHGQMFPGHKHGQTGQQLENQIIKEVLDSIAYDHPAKDELLTVCRQDLKAQEDFVRQMDLVDLTGINPLEVDWEPEFARGIAIAGLDSPGPLDKNQKSFFRVSPIPEDWTKEQEESYLREYNSYMLKELCIHEAMPGHYVQGFYNNKFPSLLRRIFGSGTFVEGWAMYAERMMIQAGYLNNDPRMELTQLKMYLKAIINAILDNKIHAGYMTREESVEFMTEEGFQEQSEAEGKWVRAVLTSTQLSTYFVGFQEIMDLEKAYREKVGDKFSRKEFSQKLLSCGAPPVRVLREIILSENSGLEKR
ncbi:MAG TPA: DUF885 domain-containing protein [candidate division Zixibacteria bacterium]